MLGLPLWIIFEGFCGFVWSEGIVACGSDEVSSTLLSLSTLSMAVAEKSEIRVVMWNGNYVDINVRSFLNSIP